MTQIIAAFLLGSLAFLSAGLWEEDTAKRAASTAADAQHFAWYRGVVQSLTHNNKGLLVGAINDNNLTFPQGMNAPAFSHEARLHGDGYVYVWSEQDAAFYRQVIAVDPDSYALCRVLESRRCVSYRSNESVLTALQTPPFIPAGSTVYVWKY